MRKNKKRIIRIVLRFNKVNTWEHCVLNSRLFEQGIGPAFFLSGDYAKPVCEEMAIRIGFTISPRDWLHLVETYWHGMLHSPPLNRRQL